jgi:ribosomal protein S18 acetylase RimI-like enzyme
MQTIHKPWIKFKETVNQDDVALINGLASECIRADGAALKLELDYKLSAASNSAPQTAMRALNELMYFDGDTLIGYIGIGSFGSPVSPLELNGMVHPAYRRQGVFQMLSALAILECKRQKRKSILLLCDRQSDAGQKHIEKTGAHYHHSEFEMYLRKESSGRREGLAAEVAFRKATNQDAREVARHNAIYFGEERNEEYRPSPEGETDGSAQGFLMPEEEERKGMTIYFALHGEQVVGKVHLQLIAGVGGIYGLGVLPEFRGKGFGRAILLGAVKQLKKSGAREVMLQVVTGNANALHLYESCGFETTSTMDYFELAL